MKRDEFFAKCDEWWAGGISLMNTRNRDYAGDDDALSNFKFEGYIIDFAMSRGVSGALLAILALRATKLCREIELCTRPAKGESIADTFADDVNYTMLMRALVEELNGAGLIHDIADEVVSQIEDEEDFADDPADLYGIAQSGSIGTGTPVYNEGGDRTGMTFISGGNISQKSVGEAVYINSEGTLVMGNGKPISEYGKCQCSHCVETEE